MGLPNTQVTQLKRGADEHSARARELRQDIDARKSEAELHELLVALGTDQNLVAALGEIYDDPGLFETAAENPKRFLTDRDVRIPRGARFAVEGQGSNSRFAMIAKRGQSTVRAEWHRTRGFSAEPERPES